MNIAGTDLLPVGKDMLAQAEQRADDAELLMNLSVVMQCVGQRDIGLAIQNEALDMKRIYRLAATRQPAKIRVLMLAVAGDLAANTPLDCLLENSDVELIYNYVSADGALASPIPEHDVLLLAMSESDENRPVLAELERILIDWPKPVVNAPQHIPSTGRATASRLLHGVPGLLIPPTLRASRAALQAIADSASAISEQFADTDFPVIVRPLDSQAGRDLEKIGGPTELTAYLSRVADAEFYLSRFIDYSDRDGLFRKYRVVLIDGEAFACHMGVSSNWMVHYVNAGMYEEAAKREEEAAFMEHFADFSRRHRSALEAIHQRTQLNYLCIDCAQTRDGQLFVFEIDHTMVVHDMDPESLFPYKHFHMQKLQSAFRDFLLRLSAAHAAATA